MVLLEESEPNTIYIAVAAQTNTKVSSGACNGCLGAIGLNGVQRSDNA